METCKMTETICTLDPCTYICLTNGGYLVTQATTIYTADYFSCLHPFGKKTTDKYTTNTHANVQCNDTHTHTQPNTHTHTKYNKKQYKLQNIDIDIDICYVQCMYMCIYCVCV